MMKKRMTQLEILFLLCREFSGILFQKLPYWHIVNVFNYISIVINLFYEIKQLS